MKLYVQLMILFVISLIGEGISSFFHLPIPGSIIGLIILFLALQFKWLRTRHVNMVGNFLLANMTILFLPPAVGIMEKFDVIAPYLLPIVLIVFFAAVINIILIALVVQFIKRRFEGDYEKGDADLQTFSPSIDNALAFVSCFHYHLSKGDGYFLPRLLPRWGLSEQLDCPIDRGSRDSAL